MVAGSPGEKIHSKALRLINWQTAQLGTESALVGVLLLGALLLRLFNLAAQPLWFDETYNLDLVERLSFFDALTYYQPWLVHPPLFLAIMNRWMRYFGMDEFALRSFALLAGVATFPVVYFIARRWINRPVALISLLLLTFSALQLYVSQTIRPYSLLTFLAALSMALAYFAVEKPDRPWRWLAYAVSAIVMIYTHYLGFHLILVQALFFALVLYKDWRALLRAGLSLALVGAAFLPWLNNFLAQSRYYGQDLGYLANDGIYKLLSALTYLAAWGLSGSVLLLVGLVFLPLYALGLFWLWQRRRTLALLLAGWSFLPFVTCWLSSLISPNFALLRTGPYCVPPFLILVATGLWSLVERSREPRRPVLAYLALGSVLVLSLAACLHYFQDYKNQDWRDIANYIAANYQPNDLIFLDNPTVTEGTAGVTRPAFDYYYVYKLGAPGNLKRVSPLAQPSYDAQLRRLFQGYNRVWLVDYFLDGWMYKNILPNLPPQYKKVYYKEYANPDQGTISVTLLIKSNP